jgi:hypothetical protein
MSCPPCSALSSSSMSAYPAMQRAARDILTHRKAGPLNEYCASSHDLPSLFPEPDVCSLRAS